MTKRHRRRRAGHFVYYKTSTQSKPSRDFVDLFLRPIVRNCKHDEMNVMDFLDRYFFCVEEREIHFYRVKIPFKMPGSLRHADMIQIQGMHPNRKFMIGHTAKSTHILARVDKRLPDLVQLETWTGPEREQIWDLTQAQWRAIQANIYKVDSFAV